MHILISAPSFEGHFFVLNPCCRRCHLWNFHILFGPCTPASSYSSAIFPQVDSCNAAAHCCSRSNRNRHNLADTSSNLSTWCRVMVTWISLGLPPATLTLFSCFGRGIVQVQVFKMVFTTRFAWRPQGYRGLRDGTCYIAMFCNLSALLIWNICKQWQSVALGRTLF